MGDDVTGSGTERTIRLVVRPGDEAPGRARHAVLDRLGAWAAGDLGFRLGLVVSELVTHAVRRGARRPMTLAVEQDGASLVVSVEDDADAVAPVLGPDPRDAARRGLLLVAALSDSWGVNRTDDGTRVWSRVDLTGTARVPSARKG
jgi:anti-sigma regulatory factor (Ser/Thr protein kinase)